MRCERCQELMVEALYDELDDATRREFDAHLGECAACAREVSSLRGTLELMDRRDRPDPGAAYWDGYWDRLAGRMERESVRVAAAPAWWRRSPVWWSARVAAAAAILLVGVFAGRTFFAPGGPAQEPQVAVDRPSADSSAAGRPGVDVATTQTQTQTPTEKPESGAEVADNTPSRDESTPRQPQPSAADAAVASSNDRAMRYVEKSQLLLIALVNNDDSEPDAYASGLDERRRRSRDLVDEADSIKEELSDPKQRRLRELVDELQKILIQISNLESDEDMDEVEFIRSRVNDHDVLLKINLEQMRQGTDAAGNASGNAHEADSKRSI